MIEVTKNVFVENSYPICNVGLIDTGDGLVMIDTPIRPTDAIKWRDIIAQKGRLKYIINTESHGDHCGNSCFFDAPMIMQSIARDILSRSVEGVTAFVRMTDPTTELLAKHRIRLADIVFDDDLTVHLGDLSFKLIHTPGHTPGNLSVYIPERKVLFAADDVIYHGKTWLHEAVPYQWMESLQKMQALKIDVIVPGHSEGQPFCNKDYLKEEMKIIEAWIKLIESAIRDRLSLEETLNTVVCPDPYPILGLSEMTETRLNQLIITRLYSVLKAH
jgi:cyclase